MELSKVHNEDCLSFMKRAEPQQFDLIIADPPYFQICGEFDYAWKDVHEYVEWAKLWILECQRLLKPDGALYLWGSSGRGKGFPLQRLAIWIEENDIFHIVNYITQKNTRGRGNYRGFVQAREELLFCAKDKELYKWNTAYLEEKSGRTDMGMNGKPRTNEYKRCTDVWADITEASQSSKERFHTANGETFPTVKAQKLCDRIILASSNPGDIVYVPFAGSGSEIVSCIRNGRQWVGTEKNAAYINEVILPRIGQ